MIALRPTNTVVMAIEELLPLPSLHQLLEPPGRRTVAHAIGDIDRLAGRYRHVRDWMAEHGRAECPVHVAPASVVLRSYGNMDQRVLALPEEVDSLWFGNGHARLAIALELGWKEILCTQDVFRSGPEYKHLVGKTPKVFKPSSREEAEELCRSATQPGLPMQKWINWATAKFEEAGWGHLLS